MNSTKTPIDYAAPYDIMVGVWTGTANVFDSKGRYLDTSPSLVAVYWQDETTLVYRQVQPEVTFGDALKASHPAVHQAAIDITMQTIVFKVDGKSATGESETFQVLGAESMPGIYLFQLAYKPGTGFTGSYVNNQYFLDSSQRNIIGPYIDGDGVVQSVVAQAFARISFDVPADLRA